MSKLQKFSESDYTSLIRVLFGLSSPTPVPEDLKGLNEEIESIKFIDPSLNDSQKDAIRFAMASKEVALIHGPPGVSATIPQAYLDAHLIRADRQDSYSDRAYSAASSASSAQAPPFGLRTF